MANSANTSFFSSSWLYAGVAALLTFCLSYFQIFQPIEYLAYDRLLRVQSEAPDNEVVIIAMDEKSLQRFGPLPWPRDVHAQMINVLTQAQVTAIGYDVLFDKARDPSDKNLIQAVKNNKKIVFPVVIENLKQDGQLLELQPFAQLNQVTPSLGLVHFQLSDDNISRGVYLRGGLGEPFWRAFSAEVLDIANGEQEYILPLQEQKISKPSFDLKKIEQSQYVMIPFKEDKHFFKRISFVELLDNQEFAAELKDKVVFVGVTATAARNADFLPVPISRDGQIMPGVEINATLYHALKHEHYIVPINKWVIAILSALIVFCAFTLLPISLPRRNFYYFLLGILGVASLMWLALHLMHQWWPLVTPLIVMTTGYLFWVWRKVVGNMTFFNQTINRLQHEAANAIELERNTSLHDKFKFWHHLKLIKQWRSSDQREGVYQQSVPVLIDGKEWLLEPENLSKKEQRLFNKLLAQTLSKPVEHKQQLAGVIENRIVQVEDAITKMNFLRRFVEKSMDKLTDGVILADNDGQVFYSNIEANNLLPELRNKDQIDLLDILNGLTLVGNSNWQYLLKQVLLEGIGREIQAITSNKRDLKVGLSLLSNVAGKDFVIINLSDITTIKREQRRQLEMIDFISHDLRSPMTSILALLSRYQSHPEEFEEKQLSADIERLTRSSLSLAEHFLMLSRTESHIEIALYPVELLNSIDNALAVIMPLAKEKNIEIAFDFMAYDDIWLNANEDLLGRVITNLLTNAVKYSPQGSFVNLDIEQDSTGLRLRVQDQGEGIDKEQMTTIFKPFTRMQRHEMAKVKGIGLGLRFVRAAMLRFGGSVGVESEPGKGSCFILKFPASSIIED
ncbi:MAG: CHASE2 domain-containing protein [Kangiellaceae bacterium]|nr:CHASE2 domain-containing protein [Kangiellaceae bacterium]